MRRAIVATPRRSVAAVAALAMVVSLLGSGVVVAFGEPAPAAAAPSSSIEALSGQAADVAALTVPGQPGIPQPGDVIYTEDFENGQTGPLLGVDTYVGAQGQPVDADPNYKDWAQCNGWIPSWDQPTPAYPTVNCSTSQAGSELWVPILKSLGYVLGQHNGDATPGANHVVVDGTNPQPGSDYRGVLLESSGIDLPSAGRFVTFSVDTAEFPSCGGGGLGNAQDTFELLDGATAIPLSSTPYSLCTDPDAQTVQTPDPNAPQARVGTFTGDRAFFLTSPTVGYRITNTQPTGAGNDQAFDNFRILDVTPQLDKAFSPASISVGGTSTLTFTVTNTDELAAKDGWSFTDDLADGLTIANPANAGGTCNATTTATAGGSSIAVTDGVLAAGEASCTITVNVTAAAAGTYENCPDTNVTDLVGLNPPACAAVEFYAFDFGDAPDGYGTMLTSDGPRNGVPGYDAVSHTAPVMLGASVDPENDGQSGVAADGDGTDEDGVSFNPDLGYPNPTIRTGLDPNSQQPVENTLDVEASADGFVSVWVDWNEDGDFLDAGEQVANAQAVTAGSNDVTFSQGTNPAGISSYVRVRYSTDAASIGSPTGAAPDGEVEDYRVLFERLVQPDTCVVTGAEYYAFTFTQPTPADLTGTGGVGSTATYRNVTVVAGIAVDMRITVVAGDLKETGSGSLAPNGMGVGGGAVAGIFDADDARWQIDRDATLRYEFFEAGSTTPVEVNGVFTANDMDRSSDGTVTESATFQAADLAGYAVTEGSAVTIAEAGGSVTFSGGQPSSGDPGSRFQIVLEDTSSLDVRWRGTSGSGFGFDGDGDLSIDPPACSDFGDAPNSYGTDAASGGPQHMIVQGVFLGSSIDVDADGQQSDAADGDGADEDGVEFNSSLGYPSPTLRTGIDPVTQQPVENTLDVDASADGFVSVWVDWNEDGDFLDAGEQVANGQAVSAGTNQVTFTQGTNPPGIETYVRVRYSTDAASIATPTGAAPDGEVEDYRVLVERLIVPDACTVNNSEYYAFTYAQPVNLTGNGSVGSSALFQNVSVVGGVAVDMRAEVIAGSNSISQFPPNGFIVTVNGGDDAGWLIRADSTIRYSFFEAGTTTPIDINGVFTVTDMDDNESATFSAADLASYAVTEGSAVGIVEAGGSVTFDGNGNWTQDPESRFQFVLEGKSTFDVRWQGGSNSGFAFDGDGDFSIQPPACSDFGDAPNSYGTDLASNGPRHTVTPGLTIGDEIDFDPNGLPTADATGDDADRIADEDAFSSPVVLNPGSTSATLTVPVTNSTGGAATLYGWIDANGNGTFEPSEFASISVPAGATSVDLAFTGLTPLQDGSKPVVRLRLTTDALSDNPATAVDERALGAANNGEVEDHLAQVATLLPLSCTSPFVETFGTGAGWGPPLPAGQTTYTYANSRDASGFLPGGAYGVVPSPALAHVAWLSGEDHTPGDTDGRMMVVNAADDTGLFFQRTFTGLSAGASYDFSAWLANALYAEVQDFPNVTFRVVDPATNQVLAELDTGNLATHPTLTWERFGLQFVASQSTVRLEMVNNNPRSLGNDIGIDDITFSPVCEFGDAPDSFGTTIAVAGAGHIATGPTLGAERDTEPDGQPNAAADGDDAAGTPDDEDGVATPIEVTAGQGTTVTVSATNDTDDDVTLAGWIDLDGNGAFDLAERVVVTVPANSGTDDYDLSFPAVTTGVDTYARFRIYGDEVADAVPTGTAAAGEVEDYLVDVTEELDFGDAPNSFGTDLASNGPRHRIVPGLEIGSDVDLDSDGQPSAAADGDDGADEADEDAFSSTLVLNPGSTSATLTVPVTNTTGAAATLYGWIDANGNGFFEPSEFASIPVPAGATSVDLAFAALTPLRDGTKPVVRLRLTTDALSDNPATPVDERALGAASNGEVEDHIAQVATLVPVSCTAPFVENFGTGAGYGAPLPAGQTTYSWEGNVPGQDGIVVDGEYALLSALNGSAGFFWHTGEDHTPGDAGGRMMVVNASYDPGIFFQRTFTGLSAGATYDFSAWIANGNNIGSVIPPNVKFRVIDPATGSVLAEANTGNIPNKASLVWERFGLQFIASQSTVRLEVVNNGPGGDGNDLVLDDISFSPVCELGDAPDSYGTLLSSNGPGHIATGPTLGTERDTELDGQPTATANGDDAAGTPDDEDGVATPISTSLGGPTSVTVSATNDSGEAVTLAGWLDLDGNGTFDAAERIVVTVPANSGTADYTLTFPEITTAADTYARFRIYGELVADPQPTGTAAAGEVEDYPVVVDEPVLEITKTSDATAGSRPGDTITYTITAENTGDGDFTAGNPAVVLDDLSGVLDDAVYNADADASDGPTPSYTSPRLSWVGELDAGATVTITYTVTLATGGDGVVRNVAFGPGCDPADPACDTTTPACDPPLDGVDPATGLPCAETELLLPRLLHTKVADRTDLPTDGEVVTYTLTVENVGPGVFTVDAPGSLTDDLSAVLDDADYNDDATADVGVAQFDAASDSLTWEGPLGAGETATITYSVTYDATSGDNQLLNVACVPAELAADPTDTCRSVQIPGSELQDRKSVNPASGTSVVAGQQVTYTLHFDNTGQSVATVDTFDDLSDVLDDATLMGAPTTSDPALTAVVNGTQLDVTGTVPAGASYTVSYTVTVNAFAQQGDHVLGNVLGGADGCLAIDPTCRTENPVRHLVVTKSSDAAADVSAGDTVTYTVTVHNDGEGAYTASTPALVQDDLSSVLDDASYNDDETASAGSVSYAEPILSWTGPLTAGDTETITYSVTVTDLGDHVLENRAGPVCTSPEICDPPVVVTTPLPHVVPAKSSDPASGDAVNAGDVVTYTLSWTNDGEAAGVVDATDDLSDVLDDADVTTEPVASDPAITVVRDGDEIRVTGAIQPDQTITVTYQVTVRSDGERGDNIAANVLTPDIPPYVCEDGDAGCDPFVPPTTSHPISELDDWKTVDPASGTTVRPGQEVTYTLHFENTGEADVAVDREDVLTQVLDDAAITITPASSDPALSVSPVNTDRFAVTGTLAPGQHETVTYTVTVNADGQRGDDRLGNALVPTGAQPSEVCVPADPQRPDCTINHVSNVVVTKSADPDSGAQVRQGQTVTYTLTFENVSANADAADVAIDYTDHMSDVLDDATLTSAPASSDGGVTAVTEGETIHITGAVASGDIVTVTYAVTVKGYEQQGDHHLGNIVAMTGEEPVCAPDSPLCTEHDLVPPPPPLAITGGSIAWGAAIGALVLLLAGGGALLIGRRRRQANATDEVAGH